MPKRWNVSGGPLVLDWGTGVIHHGESIEGDEDSLPTVGGDWSDDPKDAQRVATAGASVLSDEEKAAYTAATPKGRRNAEPAPDPAPETPVDTPKEG